jgi:hypothetical protein
MVCRLSYYIQKKQSLFLSIYLILALLLSILCPYRLDWFFILFFVIISFILILYRFNNWLIPVVSFLWKYTFLLLIWMLTYDLPVHFFSFDSMSSLQTSVILVFAQLLLLIPICFLIRQLVKLFNIVTMLNSVKKISVIFYSCYYILYHYYRTLFTSFEF